MVQQISQKKATYRTRSQFNYDYLLKQLLKTVKRTFFTQTKNKKSPKI